MAPHKKLLHLPNSIHSALAVTGIKQKCISPLKVGASYSYCVVKYHYISTHHTLSMEHSYIFKCSQLAIIPTTLNVRQFKSPTAVLYIDKQLIYQGTRPGPVMSIIH